MVLMIFTPRRIQTSNQVDILPMEDLRMNMKDPEKLKENIKEKEDLEESMKDLKELRESVTIAKGKPVSDNGMH